MGRVQFHLSTAILMMIVAGGGLGLNLAKWGPFTVSITTTHLAQETIEDYEVASFYGWPFPALEAGPSYSTRSKTPWPRFDNGFGLVMDIVIAFVVCVGSGRISEWWIRRLERRAKVQSATPERQGPGS